MIRRLLGILAFAAGFGVGAACAEPPHLEFVAGLRDRGMADLALEYLQRLQQHPPPAIAGRLLLETGKTLVALADQEEDDGQRERRLAEARAALEQFLAANPPALEAADTRFEIVRLIAREAKSRVSAAGRYEGKSERQAALVIARARLGEGLQRLRETSAFITAESAAARDDATRVALGRLAGEARLEEEVLRLQTALTLDDSTRNQQLRRIEEIEDAQLGFQNLAEKYSGGPVGWLARVWAARCHLELENKPEARKAFDAIMKETSPAAAEARRLAKFHLLQMTDQDPNLRSRTELVRACEDWLSNYSGYRKTAEGQGVEFMLASNLVRVAQAGVSPPRQEGGPPVVSPSVQPALRRAERTLKSLAEGRGDFARPARQLRAEVLALLMGERAAQGVERLANFDECYLTAQAEYFRATNPKPGEDGATALQKALRALERAARLAGHDDPPRDVYDARVMLAYMYLATGDPYSAAVLGEHLARTAPGSHGPRGAAYALNAYATILRRSLERGAPPEEIRADQERLRRLAEFMERQWPDEGETDAARFQLGDLFFEERHYPQAFDYFTRIRDTFIDVAWARYREGEIAQTVQAVGSAVPTADKERLLRQAVADLERLRPAPDPATVQAKLQLVNLYLLAPPGEENFERIAAVGRQLQKELGAVIGGDELPPRLAAESERVLLIGLCGKAYLQFQADRIDEARQTLAPAAAAKIAAPATPVLESARRDAALLDLRLRLHAGKAKDIQGATAELRKLPADAVLGFLARLLPLAKVDLGRLREKNLADRQKKLEAGLNTFVDELAGTVDRSPEGKLLVAQGYSAVGKHDRAAALLAGIARPPESEAEAVTTYRYARLQLAHEQRLNKSFTDAKATLREIMGTPAAPGWGFDNLDVRREAIELMEDEGNFAGAVRMSQEMQNRLLPAVREYDAKAAKRSPETEEELRSLAAQREQFFEFYLLEARSLVKNAQKSGDVKGRESLARLAARLVKLEQGHPDLGGDACRTKFQDLVNSDTNLGAAYAAAGGEVLQAKKP